MADTPSTDRRLLAVDGPVVRYESALPTSQTLTEREAYSDSPVLGVFRGKLPFGNRPYHCRAKSAHI